jgi:hypothetical protein
MYLLAEIDVWMKQLSTSSWEDVGNPKYYMSILTKFKKDVESGKFFESSVTFTSSSGRLDSEQMINFLSGEEAYYRSDGDYGGTEYNAISYKQFQAFLLAYIVDWEWAGEWDSKYYYLMYYAFSSDTYEFKKELVEDNSVSNILYYYVSEMKSKTETALRSLLTREISFTPAKTAASLDKWLGKEENEEYEDYYGTLLSSEGINAKATIGFRKHI